mmetsp:Transcript_37969/g.111202  ORF Transcript_37969/g.111202 Transcript_37969/m.111202 type:complete len:192 (-) Transcript_37969:102-677(-)
MKRFCPTTQASLGGGGGGGTLFTPEQQASLGLLPKKGADGADASEKSALGACSGASSYAASFSPAAGAAQPPTPQHSGGRGLFTSEDMAQMQLDAQPASPRRPTLELEGYSLTSTKSGLSVLVPTGTRKVTIEAPPEAPPDDGSRAAAASMPPSPGALPPGLGPQTSPLPPGLGAQSSPTTAPPGLRVGEQ